MAKEIFDQDRPRSTMARRLDEAFAGCEEWTLAPRPQRRSSLDLTPRLRGSPRAIGSATAVRVQEPGAL